MKRSVSIQGHRTSFSLEPAFWGALQSAAREDGRSLANLIAEIDEARSTNLSSALRVWLFERRGGTVRPEIPTDLPNIYAVEEAAFERPDEARLVDRLRAAGDVVASVVAIEKGEVVAHALFTELPIEGDRIVRAVALAPVAVRPERQKSGLGAAVIRHGLRLCTEAGREAAVVLGHPDYYPRFGFRPDLATAIRAPWPASPSFMAVELVPGALAAGGEARYAKAFFET